jgi:hypothetical protein
MTPLLLDMVVAVVGLDRLTRILLAVLAAAAVLFVAAVAVAQCCRATPWQEYNCLPFDAVPPPVAVRPAHHALPLRAEAAAWLRVLAVDALANTATLSKGIAI